MLETGPELNPSITFFRDLLEIYSPSGEEQRVAAYIVERMRELGYREAYVDEAGNAVGEIGAMAERAALTIVLLGHIDTVPGFLPVRLDPAAGTISGRGAVDAKGPFAAFVLGAAALQQEQPEMLETTRIVVIGAVEEEAPSSKGARYVLPRYRPDYCVIGEPSGWDRVTVAYKGSLQLAYELERDLKHTAADGPSVSEEGVDFWNRIKAYSTDFNREKKISETLQAYLREIRSAADGFQDRIELKIGLRVPLGFDLEEFKARLVEWAGDGRLSFVGEEQPVRSDKNSRLVRAFFTAIRAEGGQPAPKSKTGTSDMNVLGPAWKCPIVAYGPGDSSLDHTPYEYASLDEFRRGVRVVTRMIAALCASR